VASAPHDDDLELRARVRAGGRCPFCHDDVAGEDKPRWTCATCQATHHLACWAEGGSRCAGCESTAGETWGAPAAPPSDRELEQVLAEQGHAGVVAALRLAGLSEPAALECAVEVATRVELRQRDGGERLRWVLLAQAGALVVCAILAALTDAGAAVAGGALALAAPLPFLLWAGWRDGSLGVGSAVALANLCAGGLGAAMVDGLDIRRSRPSGDLAALALLLALASALVASTRRVR